MEYSLEMKRPPRLDGVQGAAEQRTELYKQYSEGVAQAATQQSAKNGGGVACSAGKQAGVARRSLWP